MQMMKEHKKGETVKELALRLSITKAHVYNLLRSGRLPGKKYEDGSWLVTDEDIDQWLASIKKKVNRSAYYNRKYKKTEHKEIWFSEETGKYKVLVRTHEYDGIVGIYDTLEEALLIRQKVLAENSPMERPVDNIYSEDEISTENVAKQFHVDTSTIYRYIRDGFLKARKNNGFWIIAKKDVPLLKKQLEDQDAQVSKKTFLKKGDRIGCWTILEPVKGMTTSGVWKSECQCICGKIKLVNIGSLEEKRALSCGCKKAEYFHLRKIQKAGERVVKCKCLTSEDISIISWEDFAIYCDRHNENPYTMMIKHFPKQFHEMQIADYILGNEDRHEANWGFFVSNDTGKILSPYPLMDHDHAFVNEKILSQTNETDISLKEAAKRASKYVNINFSEFNQLKKPDTLANEQWIGVRDRVSIYQKMQHKHNLDLDR